MAVRKKPAERRHWIAVVPKSRVEHRVARTVLNGGDEVRAFVAMGKIADGEPYQAELAEGRTGWRRDIAYAKKVRDASVYPLLDELSFIKDCQHWGIFFHRSLFSVSRDDFALIGKAMGLDPRRL